MEIKGQIEDIIFVNESNSYTVCVLLVDKEAITAVGYLPFISVGDIIVAQGNFITHATYGEQFKINTFEKAMPNSIAEIEKYLGSGIIKGVGPATSKKIVDRFGEDTIYVLQFEPYKLSQIKGITNEKAEEISNEFNNAWELWKIVMFLQKYGIGTVNASKVYKELGINAIEKIKENPYILLSFLRGIDFKNIDKMALTLGIEHDSNYRILSGIKYAINLTTKNGNTCVLKENLIEYVSNVLSVNKDLIENEFTSLCYSKEIYLENGYVFLSDYYLAEEVVAKKMLMLTKSHNNSNINLDKKIEEFEKELKIKLSQEQKAAVKLVFENKVSIITGGPGTGKTTIIKMLIKLLKYEELEFALCAPTRSCCKENNRNNGRRS